MFEDPDHSAGFLNLFFCILIRHHIVLLPFKIVIIIFSCTEMTKFVIRVGFGHRDQFVEDRKK